MQGRTQNHWNHCLINFTILIVGNILVVGFGKIELFIFYKRIYQFFNRFTSMRFLQCALHSELSYSTKWVPLQKEKAKKAAITPLNAAAVKSNLYKISIARNFHKTVDVSLFFRVIFVSKRERSLQQSFYEISSFIISVHLTSNYQ